MLIDLATRWDLADDKIINPEIVEKFHDAIWNSGPLLHSLRERGVTDDMIRYARLGFHNGRITIPVYNRHTQVVNVRRYLPGAPGNQKFRNTKGYGTPARLYQIKDVIDYDKVWICGGEMKALVSGFLLRDHDIGACAASAGEGTWLPDWNSLFKGKKVWICMDIDAAGLQGARNVARLLYKSAESIQIVILPLDKAKHPKGDLNDYIGAEEATAQDLLGLMPDALLFEPDESGIDSGKPRKAIEVKLHEASNPSSIGKRLLFNAVVTAMDTSPYLIPKEIGISCNRKQSGCAVCPIYGMEMDANKGFVEATIGSCSISILDMVNTGMGQQKTAIQSSLGIPKCKSVEFHVRSHYRVQDARLTPELTIGGEGHTNVTQTAYIVDVTCEMNTAYKFDGTVHPHPANQQATLILDDAQIAEDNLLSFSPSKEEIRALTIFRPKKWTREGIEAKLDQIYEDLEANVTRIFGRREIHLILDLTYHSVLLFNLDRREIHGWANTLIAGDSAQGKSETSIRLIEHYGLGERVECKNATVPGLLGGLQQLGTRWFVTWGVIPTHDRRLVILEEIKGASIEVIAKLTDMRSSGIAEIPKIERKRAHARTRLVFISNPRTNRSIASYNFGIEAIKELIGGLEDIRRFDAAIVVSANQVSSEVISEALDKESETTHVYTSKLCKRLVLFAWTRTPDQVLFEKEARAALSKSTSYLCGRFSEAMPLIDKGTTRYKLARLAVALAVRTFSTLKDYQTICVRLCHVQAITKFLDDTYSHPIFGYLDFSRAQIQAQRLVEPELIMKHLLGTKYPKDLVKQLLYREQITGHDFQDWCELERDEAQTLISLLTRKHAIHRQKRYYVKTAEFILLLKKMEQGGVPIAAQTFEEEEM